MVGAVQALYRDANKWIVRPVAINREMRTRVKGNPERFGEEPVLILDPDTAIEIAKANIGYDPRRLCF
jgi:hypothetical protein